MLLIHYRCSKHLCKIVAHALFRDWYFLTFKHLLKPLLKSCNRFAVDSLVVYVSTLFSGWWVRRRLLSTLIGTLVYYALAVAPLLIHCLLSLFNAFFNEQRHLSNHLSSLISLFVCNVPQSEVWVSTKSVRQIRLTLLDKGTSLNEILVVWSKPFDVVLHDFYYLR